MLCDFITHHAGLSSSHCVLRKNIDEQKYNTKLDQFELASVAVMEGFPSVTVSGDSHLRIRS
jgi:hypothetical protein